MKITGTNALNSGNVGNGESNTVSTNHCMRELTIAVYTKCRDIT